MSLQYQMHRQKVSGRYLPLVKLTCGKIGNLDSGQLRDIPNLSHSELVQLPFSAICFAEVGHRQRRVTSI
jgi:hypothetical protein